MRSSPGRDGRSEARTESSYLEGTGATEDAASGEQRVPAAQPVFRQALRPEILQQPPERGLGRRGQREAIAHRDDAAAAVSTAQRGGNGAEQGAGVADRHAAWGAERGEPQAVPRPGLGAHQLEEARRKQAALEKSTEEP